MKTNMKGVLAVAVVATMVFAAAGAYAEGWGGQGGKGGKEGHFKKITEQLQLTPQQKAELDKQREAFMAKTKDLREKMRAVRTALKTELDKATPDKAQITGLIDQFKDLVGQQIQTRVDKVMAMKQVLTPEQYTKMTALREEHKAEWQKKKGEHGDRPEGPEGI